MLLANNNIINHALNFLVFPYKLWKDHGYVNVEEQDLMVIVNDLFMAGVETTLSTIRWFFLYILHHPEYQQKIYHEIKTKIGFKRPVTYNDADLLPTAQAAILETHRLAAIAPLGVLHNTTTDTSVGGHSIPRNIMVIFNHYWFKNNKNDWGNPDEFKPERCYKMYSPMLFF